MVLEPLTYIRGRSIPHQFMIVDEAQNLTPHEVKTIASRVGEGTKLVLTGDATQIDNPYLDSSSNGLSYLVERLKGKSIVGHVTLGKERAIGIGEPGHRRVVTSKNPRSGCTEGALFSRAHQLQCHRAPRPWQPPPNSSPTASTSNRSS